jgi:hypothetical protein
MRKSTRALTAAAVLTVLLAGPSSRAAAQFPPDAAPLSRPVDGFAPPGMMPGGPPGTPYVVDGGAPMMATDSLGSVAGGAAHGSRAYFGVEYLLYWTKHAPVPFAVATIGPRGSNGAIGSPGVQTLFGNTDIGFNNFSGIRALAGIWLTQNESLALEGNFFILPSKHNGTPALPGSDLLPVLARPFFDTANNRQNSLIVSQPGTFLGSVQTTAGLQLWGAELGPVWRAIDRGRWTLDTGAAFKFLSLDESLNITSASSTLAGGISVLQGRAFASPSVLSVTDNFRTTNNFYGGTLMARANAHVEAFTWSLTGKLGLGWMDSNLYTTGSSTITSANPAITSNGGLFAAGPNLGTFNSSKFTVIPEFALNMNAQVTSHIALNVGYNFLYVNNVLRPGDQITGRMNPNAVPASSNFGVRSGPAGSNIPLATSSFWAQGFNLGLIIGF